MTSTQGNTNRWRAFALLAVAYFMTVVDFTIVNVSLPTIGRDLHLSATGLQWVVTAYALTFGGFLLFGGRAADLLGRRRILMLGLALFTAASLACGLATQRRVPDRRPGGAGAGRRHHAARCSLNRDEHVRGGRRAQQGARDLGRSRRRGRHDRTDRRWDSHQVRRLAVDLLSERADRRCGTRLSLPRIVPDSRLATTGRRFDVFGAIAGTGGLVLLVDAISQAPQYGWGATRTIVLLAASIAVLIAFLVIESRVKDPLLPLSIFRLRMLAGANVAGLLLGGSFFAFVFAGTLYMQQVLHYSALQTGAAWAAASVTSLALAGTRSCSSPVSDQRS